MGGSNYYKDVANYDLLAKYYDELLGDETSFNLWLEYIKKYIKGQDILELASGSGVFARMMEDSGYHVLASDISLSMKEIAKKQFDGEYQVLNMIDFKLDREFDGVVCIVDSMNYLNDYDEMKQMFLNIYKHLKIGGAFIFDMHHINRLKEFSDEYIEEGSLLDVDYQWTIEADHLTNELYERFVFYTDQGMISEHHLQHVFDFDKTKNLLKECGFEVIGVEDFIENEKVLLIGVKK